MMISPNYASFLPFTPNEAGRKVYIDPDLIVDFAQYIDPRTESGRGIIGMMDQHLSSLAGGLTSGQASSEPKAFFIDFGNIEGHTVRVFYTIFQDSPPGTSKGAGVFVTKILRFSQNIKRVKTGLFDMRYESARWRDTEVINGKLTKNILRIGSKSIEGRLTNLNDLSGLLLSEAAQESYKTDFNLYHAPLAIVEYGEEYITPESRRMILNPQDLADILYGTASIDMNGLESSLKYESYTCYVHGDGAKILKDALGILSRQGKKLEGFNFKLYSPSVPFTEVRHLAEACAATATLDKASMSFTALQYQKLDDGSLEAVNIEARNRIKNYLASNPASSFQELWLHMKAALLPVEG